jgi:hypothetical protein
MLSDILPSVLMMNVVILSVMAQTKHITDRTLKMLPIGIYLLQGFQNGFCHSCTLRINQVM